MDVVDLTMTAPSLPGPSLRGASLPGIEGRSLRRRKNGTAMHRPAEAISAGDNHDAPHDADEDSGEYPGEWITRSGKRMTRIESVARRCQRKKSAPSRARPSARAATKFRKSGQGSPDHAGAGGQGKKRGKQRGALTTYLSAGRSLLASPVMPKYGSGRRDFPARSNPGRRPQELKENRARKSRFRRRGPDKSGPQGQAGTSQEIKARL